MISRPLRYILMVLLFSPYLTLLRIWRCKLQSPISSSQHMLTEKLKTKCGERIFIQKIQIIDLPSLMEPGEEVNQALNFKRLHKNLQFQGLNYFFIGSADSSFRLGKTKNHSLANSRRRSNAGNTPKSLGNHRLPNSIQNHFAL